MIAMEIKRPLINDRVPLVIVRKLVRNRRPPMMRDTVARTFGILFVVWVLFPLGPWVA